MGSSQKTGSRVSFGLWGRLPCRALEEHWGRDAVRAAGWKGRVISFPLQVINNISREWLDLNGLFRAWEREPGHRQHTVSQDQKEKGSVAGIPAVITTFIVMEANWRKTKQHARGRKMNVLGGGSKKTIHTQRNIYTVCREPERCATEVGGQN